jgi:large subunit ribosomal protein L15
MGLNNLKPADRSKQTKKRVGRGPGSGNGKTAGRGHKGAQSRSGYSYKRGFEGGQMPLHRRLPKRGFTNIFRTEYVVVNLDQLEARFDAGAAVTPESLRESGLVSDRTALIKILGRGEISKALTVQAHKFSGTAAEKLAAAGGTAQSIGETSTTSRPPAGGGPANTVASEA